MATAPTTPFVWLVDDDDIIRESFSELFTDEGLRVESFASADEALRTLRSGARPDVVVLDAMMPGLSGPEFLATVRGDPALPRLKVIAFSAAHRTMPGADLAHSKPGDPLLLVDQIRQLAKA